MANAFFYRKSQLNEYSLSHKLGRGNLEQGRVNVSDLLDGESPAMETGTETNGSLGGVHTHLSHGSSVIIVGSNDNIHVLNNTLWKLEK